MADIFLSYARKDAIKAGILAERLESAGWSVWWDPGIQTGKGFRETILNELEHARCAIVIWSRTSIGSTWVLAEANEGMQRKILLPILATRNVEPPLPFGELQTVLLPWGHPQLEESPEFVKLLLDIEALIGKPDDKRRTPPTTLQFSHYDAEYALNCNTMPDPPDRRDREYQPSIIRVVEELVPPDELRVLDMGRRGDATTFGLASVINFQQSLFKDQDFVASPAMIHAKALDEDQPAKSLVGSLSCRMALKAWQHWGVCDEKYWHWKHKPVKGWEANSRGAPLSAYFRVREDSLHDIHSALNEVGVVYAAAWIHEGWVKPNQGGRIEPSDIFLGGHAFAIVGYNFEGFWIQMTWGERWGHRGLALLPYQDWIEHGIDVWIAVPGLPVML